MITLVACAAALAFLPGAIGKDKIKHQVKTPILAVAVDGTSWIAGTAKFSATGGTLEVTFDLASGVPNARVWLAAETAPPGALFRPELVLILTDDRGNLKYTQLYAMATLEPFDVWVSISVEGSPVSFGTDKSNPVTVDP